MLYADELGLKDNKIIEFSVFSSGELVADPHVNLNDGYTPSSFAHMLSSYILGVVCNEQDHVRSESGIVEDYTHKAFTLLKGQKDSSLLPKGIHSVWDGFNSEEQKSIEESSNLYAKGIEKFPLGKLKVIDTLVDCVIDISDYDIPYFIPVIVGASKGSAGIIPVKDKKTAQQLHGILPHIIKDDTTNYIVEYHLWDVSTSKVVKKDVKDPSLYRSLTQMVL